jgi:hypothetical protein
VVLAHLGGLPLEESLIYLVPPIGVVAWIWVLGRRGRDDPPELDEPEDDEPAAAPTGTGRGDRST